VSVQLLEIADRSGSRAVAMVTLPGARKGQFAFRSRVATFATATDIGT
jgi:hypothetical protein